MKIQIKNYTFNKTAKTITFNDYASIDLNSILLITNTTSNVIIYNFASNPLGGTVSGNILTLTYNTSSMNNTDALLIYYDDATYDTNKNIWFDFKRIFQALIKPPWYDPSIQRVRETAIIESGTVTTVTTCSTVTSLSDQVNMGTYQALLVPRGQNMSSWAMVHRTRIS